MPIRILSADVASKIAAGEVVERPASVVKELLENSLDAGATQIAIEVQGGGVRLIRVVDNGAGIPPEEVDLAFERFATSKVATADDLEGISSLGFRGEALPSIAAVSEVTMVTRSRDELSGVFVNIKDGAILEKAKRGCPIGTTVTVRNLFRNVPARLKFLKSSVYRERPHQQPGGTVQPRLPRSEVYPAHRWPHHLPLHRQRQSQGGAGRSLRPRCRQGYAPDRD